MAFNKYELMKEEYVLETSQIHFSALIPHICLMLIGIGFITIIFALLKMITTKLMITSKRVIGVTGIIHSVSMDAPIHKINCVIVKQGLFGKWFNYGHVKVFTSSGMYYFKQISDPHKLKFCLCKQIDAYSYLRA